jgi:hypothetical protein
MTDFKRTTKLYQTMRIDPVCNDGEIIEPSAHLAQLIFEDAIVTHQETSDHGKYTDHKGRVWSWEFYGNDYTSGDFKESEVK